MKEKKITQANAQQEVNLKLFFQKVFKNKMLFILSIGSFVGLAIIYISLATPIYEASTSLLIDSSGKNRVLGDSQYVEGGVGLIEMDKNLFNEIGIIKSFSLVNQTVKDLGFGVSYYGGNWIGTSEYYGYFPFEVSIDDSEAQLYNVPFEVKLLPNDKFQLSIEADDFLVSFPSKNAYHKVKRDFNFSGVFSFGETVSHDYFTFVLNKPNFKVNLDDFKDLEISFVVHNIDDVTNAYLSKLKVDNIDIQASIFNIVSHGPQVNKEIDFLKKLAENYIQNKLVSRNKIAASKESFIRNQLKIITDSLVTVESDLELFKRDKHALNLGATATNALGRSQNLQVERAKIEMDIKYHNSLIEYVEKNTNSEDLAMPTIGIDNALINENIIELQRLYAEKSKKKFFVTSNNEQMSILNKQIKEATSLLLNNLRNAVASSELALQEIKSQLSNYNGVISSLPNRQKQLLSIERQSTLYSNLYNYLNQELAKTGIARAESLSDAQVLDEARMVGDGPIAPQKMLILVLAMTLGTIIPLTKIVFFSPDDIVENIGQIIEHTDIPLIASITRHDSESKISDEDISLWKVKESFRDLFANLKFSIPKKECCILGITSIMPGEGKTFCAINIGITLAEAGKKTIIIDTDIRSPSLVTDIEKINGKGLSNYLQGDIRDYNEIIYRHDSLNDLDFIPTEVVHGNIHGLLSGANMKSLIIDLKDRYDYIVLDTPAAGLVSDFLLFTDVIDVNLFVIRRKVGKIAFLRDFEKLITRGKRKKSFIIFNDAKGNDHKYGYGEKYGVNSEPKLISDSLSV